MTAAAMIEEPCIQANSPEDPARDFTLMLRVKTGDVDAFRELVQLHQRRIIVTVARMLGDEIEAEDVAQAVFIRVWKSAPRWEPTAKFTTWLYTILRNLVFNECRRRARHKTTSLDAATDDEDHPHQFADGNVKAPATTATKTPGVTAGGSTTAPRWPTRWPGAWWCRRTETAARPSTWRPR